MIVIKVDYDPATQKLRLPNNGHTRACRSDKIQWLPDSSVHITNIYVKKSMPSTPFFSKLPHRDGSSENWQAIIDDDAAIGSEYEYSIFYTLDRDTHINECDPIISINPRIDDLKVSE